MRNLVEKQLSWLALLVTAFYSLLGSCRSQECGHERLVKCGRPFERLNNNGLGFGMEKEKLQQICPELEAGAKCIQTYTLDCLQEKQRDHFNALYVSANKVVMELCQEGPYQDEFLKHAPCMQKVQSEYELCDKKFQKTTQEIGRTNHTTMSLDKTFQSVCCAFREYLECSHHTVRRQCGEDTAQFTKEFLDRMSNSLLRAHCVPYTNEVCAIASYASVSRAQTMVALVLVLLARYFT